MTPTDALAFVREMDLLVTDKVMKWRISRDLRRDLDLTGWVHWEEWIAWLRGPANYPWVKDTGERLIIFSAPGKDGKTWSPSSSIEDAWKVVEAMDTYFRLARDSREVAVQFDVREGRAIVTYSASAETASLAICRAALRAVEGRL